MATRNCCQNGQWHSWNFFKRFVILKTTLCKPKHGLSEPQTISPLSRALNDHRALQRFSKVTLEKRVIMAGRLSPLFQTSDCSTRKKKGKKTTQDRKKKTEARTSADFVTLKLIKLCVRVCECTRTQACVLSFHPVPLSHSDENDPVSRRDPVTSDWSCSALPP